MLDGLDGGFDIAVASDNQYLAVGLNLAGFFEDFHAAQIGHAQVGEDDVEIFLIDLPAAGVAAGGQGDFVALAFECLSHHFGMRLFIVDNKNSDTFAGAAWSAGGLHGKAGLPLGKIGV